MKTDVPSLSAFDNLCAEDLMGVVNAYVTRTFDEDIRLLETIVAGADTLAPLCQKLHTSLDRGTADAQAMQRDREDWFGRNVFGTRKPTPFWYLLYSASKDFILRILMAAAIVSLALGLAFGERKEIEWIEGAAILLAVIIVLLVTAGNDWMKERQFAQLLKKDEKFSSVRRRYLVHEVPVEELLVGDIILVEAGDEVAADCLALTSNDLVLDESSMTGESAPLKKGVLKEALVQREDWYSSVQKGHDKGKHHVIKSPVVLSGTTVTSGSANLLVIAVGHNSQAGQLMQKLSIDTDPTPLQNKLNALAQDIGNTGFAAACVTLAVLILEYWILYAVEPAQRTDMTVSAILNSHVQFLVEAITIIVVAVPEGLPLAVTLSLAFSVGRMLKDQNYVRRLAACETMGGANEICSDKTGTLTKNRMAVQAFWNGSQITDVDTNLNRQVSGQLANEPKTLPACLEEPLLTVLVESIALNSTGYLEESNPEKKTEPAKPGKKWKLKLNPEKKSASVLPAFIKHVGSPTECGLIQYITDMGFDYSLIRQTKGAEEHIVYRVPFSSERKLMTTVVRSPSGNYRVYVKGAAEIVLQLCSKRVDCSGVERSMDASYVLRTDRQVIRHMAYRALRTICLAYKDFSPLDDPGWRDPVNFDDLPFSGDLPARTAGSEGGEAPPSVSSDLKGKTIYRMELGLTCLGIAGMSDPVRDEVPAAVRRCQEAGIRVRMVTGDNLETAKQIAILCNIYHPETGGLAMTGAEFFKLVGGIVCESCCTAQCDCPLTSSPVERRRRASAASPASSASLETPSQNATATSTPAKSPSRCCGWSKPSPERRRTMKPKKTVRVDAISNLAAFESIVENLEVLARSQPTDKYALVLGLKALGSVVAVTGDGTNDAPALRKADVGFAMGLTGKEVAKQASDIVLLDDNFESIVRAVKWGRNIYDNIRRFLQFQLTVNVVAVVTAFVGAVVLRSSPLNAVQLLWINLIMDALASLALATEPPTEKLLDRRPHSRTDYLINRTMMRNILGQATYQLAVMMSLIFAGDYWIPENSSATYAAYEDEYPDYSQFSPHGGGNRFVCSGRRFYPFSNTEQYKHTWSVMIGPSRHYTVVFNAFVWLQVFNMINARKIANEVNVFAGAMSNGLWLVIMVVIGVLQVLLVQFAGFTLDCHLDGLTLEQWGLCVLLGSFTLVVQLLLHLVPAEQIKFIPQTGQKESDLLTGSTSVALASRGRVSADRVSSRLASGLRNSRHDVRGGPRSTSRLAYMQRPDSNARRRFSASTPYLERIPAVPENP